MNKNFFFIIVLSVLLTGSCLADTTENNTPLATCLQSFGGGCTKFERCTSPKCDTKEICTRQNNNFVCEDTTLQSRKKSVHPLSYLPKELDNTITYQPVSVFQDSVKRITPQSNATLEQYHSRINVTSGSTNFNYGTTYPTYIQTSVFTSGNDLRSDDRHNVRRSYEISKYNQLLDYKTSKVKSRLNDF